ncbi:MAG TPA: APC family permease [Blastocatellia bacterium]|nr:APC family permease [Blastocatellia bacterium]
MQSTQEASAVPIRSRGRLLKILGVGFGLAVIVGNTIGAGILRQPGEIAARLPNVWMSLGVWVAGGLYALLGSISIAELGATLPLSGGQYVFARRALGDYAGFVVGWSDWISTCGATAYISLVIAEFASALAPALKGRDALVALIIAATFALLQWRGIREGSGVQNITSLLKAMIYISLVAACFALGGRGFHSIADSSLSTTGIPPLAAFVVALQGVIYTYDGWTGVIYFSEEVRDPARDIPRAMFGGVLSVIAIYLLVNLAVLYVLPISEVAGKDLALGAAAQEIFGSHGDAIFRSLVILAMFSAVNACHLMATRVLFAMSRDGLFAKRAADVNRGGTPAIALAMSAGVAVAFILSGTVNQILAVVSFFFVANYTVSFISLFVLRRREPERERPYRAWGYPSTTALSLLGSIAFLAGAIKSDTQNSLYALAVLAASYPVYYLLKRFSRR